MPPSLSSIERGNPPPRRKSCAACIKAKRRCDLHQPSCLRCTQRRIDCSYPTPAGNHPKRRGGAIPSPSQSETSPIAQAQDELIMKDVALTETSTSWESSFDFSMDLSPAYTNNPSCAPFPNISFDEPVFHGLEFLDDVVDTHNPMDLLRVASELKEKRLRYIIDAYKSAPEEMVLTGGTPWSHPALYKDSMPLCLEDAVAASGLYRAKNSANGPMIQRIVELRYRRLLAAPIPTSVPEQLARTHALILYQIMLFFDESCPSRALSQETVSVLIDSAMSLLEHADYESSDSDSDSPSPNSPRNIPLYPLTAARALYTDWVFQESLRRTLLIAFLLTQMQCLLQADFSSFITRPFDSSSLPAEDTECFGPSDTAPSDASALAAIRLALQEQQKQQQGSFVPDKKFDPGILLCQSFTLSAHLWHARDAVDFAVAWRDRNHLVVKPFNIWKRIDMAQVDDIDKLGRMVMTSGMGIEEAKGWFASRGGSL
ncbi:hypothetical protein RRF57_001803 [Xylaria bambusicola]|uniref:Zn(2)-C6 fungal-type domain-containing protein n=1 Tax=Xylaria bambusicola TaxID=326684 RepID=A0AAN7UDI5_9PEZI